MKFAVLIILKLTMQWFHFQSTQNGVNHCHYIIPEHFRYIVSVNPINYTLYGGKWGGGRFSETQSDKDHRGVGWRNWDSRTKGPHFKSQLNLASTAQGLSVDQ